MSSSSGAGSDGHLPLTQDQLAAAIELQPATISLFKGQSVQLSAVVRDANGAVLTDAAVRWSSSNSAVVAIDTSGRATGGSLRGTAQLTATSGSATVSAQASSGDLVPLTQMGSQTYLGFSGGLYPNASNEMPAAHAAAGLAAIEQIQKLDASCQLSASGKYVLMSMGMSNTTQSWCTANGTVAGGPCNSWTFSGLAAADASVDSDGLVIANGAKSSQTADKWDAPEDTNYTRVRDQVLAPQGLSECQVQAVWLKIAHAQPSVSLPDASADAHALMTSIGKVARAAKIRYPNLRAVFLSSRIYAGYASVTLNPEPYAYESGFAVKWAIEAQINQMASGGATVDARAGDLNLSNGTAPWLAWGPYLWADGEIPRADGLAWLPEDLEGDGTHPGQTGESKVASQLLGFFKGSAFTIPWFLGR